MRLVAFLGVIVSALLLIGCAKDNSMDQTQAAAPGHHHHHDYKGEVSK